MRSRPDGLSTFPGLDELASKKPPPTSGVDMQKMSLGSHKTLYPPIPYSYSRAPRPFDCSPEHYFSRRPARFDLGISGELAVWSIMEYGAPDLQVQRDLLDLRRDENYPLLVQIRCADRDELSWTFSEFKSETNVLFSQSHHTNPNRYMVRYKR